MRGRVFGPLAIAIALSAMTAGGIIISQGDSGPTPTGTANIWIDDDGGTCTDGAAREYVDAEGCSTWDNANDTCESGDTIGVMADAYGSQTITGSNSRAGTCTFRTAESQTVTLSTLVHSSSAYLTFVGPAEVTFQYTGDNSDNIVIDNYTFDYQQADRDNAQPFHATGMGGFSVLNSEICCITDANGMMIIGADDEAGSNDTPMLFQDTDMHDVIDTTNGVIHSECIWSFSLDNVTFERSRFWNCAAQDVFLTGCFSGCTGAQVTDANNATNWVFRNTVMQDPSGSAANTCAICFRTGSGASGDPAPNADGVTIEYTTIDAGIQYNGTGTGGIHINNSYSRLGWPCGAPNSTYSYNVTPTGVSNCGGTGTFSASLASINAGFVDPDNTGATEGDYQLLTGSPLKNVGNVSSYPALDLLGVARYFGGAPDIGAYELQETGANIWVEVGGGTCAGGRSGTPITYAAAVSPDRICGTLDAAWDAMSAGDIARIVAGTYPEQIISGDKASTATLIGEGAVGDVIIGNGGDGIDCPDGGWSVICADANNITLQNVTSVVTDPGPNGNLKVDGTGVTVRDFAARGGVSADGFYGSSIGVNAVNFFWDGGSLGRESGEVPTCAHSSIEPFWFQSGGDNAVIDGVAIGAYNPKTQAGPNCGGDNIPHIETIRFEDSDNIIFRNNRFYGPSDAGSGHIFTSSDPDNITFINNIFEDRELGNGMVQCNACTASGWRWLYNTILDDGGSAVGGTISGNFGYQISCGTNTKNVWSGSGSCGTDTYIGGASFGLDSNNKLQSGSPAIDAAETPGASDFCTDTATVNSLDFENTSRPQGSICDAGADER